MCDVELAAIRNTMAAHVLECYTCYKGQEAFEASLININEVSKQIKSSEKYPCVSGKSVAKADAQG